VTPKVLRTILSERFSLNREYVQGTEVCSDHRWSLRRSMSVQQMIDRMLARTAQGPETHARVYAAYNQQGSFVDAVIVPRVGNSDEVHTVEIDPYHDAYLVLPVLHIHTHPFDAHGRRKCATALPSGSWRETNGALGSDFTEALGRCSLNHRTSEKLWAIDNHEINLILYGNEACVWQIRDAGKGAQQFARTHVRRHRFFDERALTDRQGAIDRYLDAMRSRRMRVDYVLKDELSSTLPAYAYQAHARGIPLRR
jgi:hypothetical protein